MSIFQNDMPRGRWKIWRLCELKSCPWELFPVLFTSQFAVSHDTTLTWYQVLKCAQIVVIGLLYALSFDCCTPMSRSFNLDPKHPIFKYWTVIFQDLVIRAVFKSITLHSIDMMKFPWDLFHRISTVFPGFTIQFYGNPIPMDKSASYAASWSIKILPVFTSWVNSQLGDYIRYLQMATNRLIGCTQLHRFFRWV